MQKNFIEIDGARMSYVDQGQGFPILLGHSYLWSAAMWQPQIDALSRHFRVIVPELWGHGDSDAPPATTTDMSALARQHLALLDALDIARCHLVGLSVGGMWGVELAADHPERVDRLVLMDTYLGAEPEATRMKYFALLDAASAAGCFSDALLDIIVPIFFHAGGQTVPEVRKQFRADLKASNAQTIRQSLDPMGRLIFSRPDLLPRLAELVRERSIVLCGDQDIPRPPEEAAEMSRIIGCLAAHIPDAGHISSLENPQVVNAFLLNWLPRNA
ncbi:alpha/beta fold hydrolase [Pseudomonas plecoglossicida]|uniref:Alpha/beta fold hydrolase n=1 Tax=Pseudomonas plecoglossicida TaxID=70775 RepID=A0AAD0QYC2_PSEDL|nr:alpha/beta fold hydrolase [Pseudomonas plecoglossicida]AXM97128.1 alpha/beta fold hydrolase [Pseudomonas plecoglossicida]EPB96612.1 hydrolase alpha/beta fold family protein [Pseudomonas plecoglossicida NB2011]QLB53502.1 alpha/beta fold hydrolase [Pseudomonas plecoglossicida]GLR36516.1 2-succinyl-6-hydroxy-2,4-cyclohexadiene-1-carboxy late synthase [Pseudomonas plecoglossicida]